MGNRTRARRGPAETRTNCPWCGRPLASLATGQCIYCLRQLPGSKGELDAGEILRLWEFDRDRNRIRRRGAVGPIRRIVPVVVGVLAAVVLCGLFALCLRWANSFFARRSVAG